MKQLLLLMAFVTAFAQPTVKTWTFDQLNQILSACQDNECVDYPHLVDALNKMMAALFTGTNTESIMGALPAPSGSDIWTSEEITDAIHNATIIEEYQKHLSMAKRYLEYTNKNSTKVLIPALDISTWTLDDLSAALNSSISSEELISILEKARTDLKNKLNSDTKTDTISIVTSVGLLKDYQESPILLPVRSIN